MSVGPPVPVWEIRMVASSAGARWRPWLEHLADHFAGAEAFEAWCIDLQNQVTAGMMEVLAAECDGELVAGLMMQHTRGHRTIILVMGAWPDDILHLAMRQLQTNSLAITWSEETAPGWAGLLAPLGILPFTRQTFYQDLDRIPLPVEIETAVEDAWAPRPWSDSYRGEAVRLLAAANAGTLDGLFLTLPEPPCEAACAACLDRVLAGVEGDFLPEASFVVVADGVLLGVVLGNLAPIDETPVATLFELAVLPAAQGQGLSRRLVRAMQQALLQAGHRRMAFLTTDSNAPVHRLFTPDEILRLDTTCGAYWIAPTVVTP